MQKNEVPQDRELLGDHRQVCYAVDENDRYVLAETGGWEPANIANSQAWEAISTEITGILEQIKRGERSPLAYHMVANQMDVKLLADYAGLFCWQVRKHLKPVPFGRLKPSLKIRYANLFSISADELELVPDDPRTFHNQNSVAIDP